MLPKPELTNSQDNKLTVPGGCHHPSFAWRLSSWLVACSVDDAFLDRPWIGLLFSMCPRSFRRGLALRLLSLSPHHWIYQWSSEYGTDLTRNQVLESEFLRNVESRNHIFKELLAPFLKREMTVLDFGCGPGFLAKETSFHVRHVIATDVSRGVIACARQLNPSQNVTYIANGISDLANINDASIDLIYSFAVFQHLRKNQVIAFFQEFARVLRPGSQGVLHMILKDEDEAFEYNPDGWWEKRLLLRMVSYTKDEVAHLLRKTGFTGIDVQNISDIADIQDDIGAEQILTFHSQVEMPAR